MAPCHPVPLRPVYVPSAPFALLAGHAMAFPVYTRSGVRKKGPMLGGWPSRRGGDGARARGAACFSLSVLRGEIGPGASGGPSPPA